MSWWRKKADDEAGDDILDLKDVVWRGVNQNDRLERLAEAAKQTDGELPEPGEKIYPPKQILPTVPLPVSAGQSTASTDQHQNSDFKTEEMLDDDDLPLPQDDLSAPEQFIETEIRNQIITEAMDAVLHFQKGQEQSPQENDFDSDELEAAIGEIADQTLAAAQTQQADGVQPPPQPMPVPEQATTQAIPKPQSPDMSDAIRDVVADEIGLWLKDHMPRIISETMAQAAITAGQSQPTIPTKPAKTAPKKPAKKASQSKAKPKVKAKAAKKSVKNPKSKAKKGKS